MTNAKRHFRVAGGPGCGKTSLIAQFALAHPSKTLIVVTPGNFENVWQPLMQMALEARGELIIVFLDFHEMCRRGADGALADFVRACDEPALDHRVRVIAEYRTSESPIVAERVPDEQWSQLGFSDELQLEPLPREFIEAVFDFTCEELSVSVTESMREKCLDAIVNWDNTPLAVVDWLSDYRHSVIGGGDEKEGAFYPAPLQSVQTKWRSKFQQMRKDRARTCDAKLLQTMAVFRVGGIPTPNDARLLSKYVAGGSFTPGDIEKALASLQSERWLSCSPKRQELQAHDVHVSTYVVGLVRDNGSATDDFIQQAKYILALTDFEARAQLAAAAGRMLMGCGEWDIACTLLSTAQPHLPGDSTLSARIAICRTHQDDEEEINAGIKTLRKIAEADSSDPRPAVALAHALARQGKPEEGIQAIRELLLKDGMVPVRARLAAVQTVFSLHDFLGAAEIAREMLRSPALSDSTKAMAACALAQTGFLKEGEGELKKLCEAGLRHSSVLGGLALCYSRTKPSAEAVTQFRAAIHTCPHDPFLRYRFAEFVATMGDEHRTQELAHDALDRLRFCERLLHDSAVDLREILAVKALLLVDTGRHGEGLELIRSVAAQGGTRKPAVLARMALSLDPKKDKETIDRLHHVEGHGFGIIVHPGLVFEMANAFREDGKWNASTAEFEGKSYANCKLFANAEKVLLDGLAIEPHNQECVATLANVLQKQEKWNEAAELLARFRKETGNETYASYEAASWHYAHEYGLALESSRIAAAKPDADLEIKAICAVASYYAADDYHTAVDLLGQIPFEKLRPAERLMLISGCNLCSYHDRALAYARQYISLGVGHSVTAQSVGFSLLANGTEDDAKTLARTLHEIHPEEWEFAKATCELAALLDQHGHDEAAIRCVRAAMEVLPNFQPLRTPLAARLCDKERWEEALSVLNRPAKSEVSFDQVPEQMARICIALSLTESFLAGPEQILDHVGPFARLLAAGTAVVLKRYQTAIELIAQDAAQGLWPPQGGRMVLPVKNHEDVLGRACETWLATNKDQRTAIAVRYVLASLREPDSKEMEAILREAVDAFPESVAPCVELMQLLQHGGRVAELLPLADHVIQRSPADPLAWENKALALSGLGRSEEALHTCEQALTEIADPCFQPLIRRQRVIALRDLAEHSELDQARALYEQAVADAEYVEKRNASSPEFILAYVASLAALGRSDDACLVALEGATRYPGQPEVLHACSFALAKANRHEELLDVKDYARLFAVSFFAFDWFNVATAWAKKHNDLLKHEHSYRGVFGKMDAADLEQVIDPERVSDLKKCGLIEMMNVSRKLGIQQQALSVLSNLPKGYEEIHEYWLAVAVLGMDTEDFKRSQEAANRLLACDNLGALIDQWSCLQTHLGELGSLATRPYSVAALEALAFCELAADRWERSVKLANLRHRFLGENKDLWQDVGFCATLLANTPEGTKMTCDSAHIVLKVCTGFSKLTLTEAGIEMIRRGLGRFDLQGAFQGALSRPYVAAALASILLCPEFLKHPAVSAIALQADRIRERLENRIADDGHNSLVMLVRNCLGED